MEIAETGLDGAVVLQPPVIDDQHEVAVDLDGYALIDDQDAIEPSGQLLRRSEVGVKPKRTGIRRGKVVIEALARLDWRLSQVGDAIHGIGQPQAVPMYDRRLMEIIHQTYLQLVALLDPKRRTRAHPIIAPDRSRLLALAAQLRQAWSRMQDAIVVFSCRLTASGLRQRYCSQGNTCTHDQTAARERQKSVQGLDSHR